MDDAENRHPGETDALATEDAEDYKDDQVQELDEEDELAANMYISESNFKFEDFGRRLINPKVVRACGLALRKFESNSSLTNHCILKLLHRIAVDSQMHAMVFQVSIFQTFEKILKMTGLPQFMELQKFAKFIIRKFIKVAQKNELVYMEALFWKSKGQAYEIDEGYGSLQKEKKPLSIWDEPAEEELQRLFNDHQMNNIEEDIVDYVWSNIIDSSKTRKAVEKKLKDMDLLSANYKPRKKPPSAAEKNRQWDAEDENELKDLYEKYRDDTDPLGCIMAEMDKKRPKNRIIEKMLVMGLIDDRKQVRKKRGKKSKSGEPAHSDIDDASDSNSDSDNNNDVSNRQSSSGTAVQRAIQKAGIQRTTIKKPSRKAKPKPASISRQELSKLLIELVDAGMSDALDWVRDSFSDAVEDLEADDDDGQDEGIPLVPLMEHSITAMDNAVFLRALRAMNVHEPADEQENFWRIASSATAENLKENCDLIKQAIDKTLIVQERPLVATDETNNVGKEPDNQEEENFVDSNRPSTSSSKKTEKEKKMKSLINKRNNKVREDPSKRRAKARVQTVVESDDDSNDISSHLPNDNDELPIELSNKFDNIKYQNTGNIVKSDSEGTNKENHVDADISTGKKSSKKSKSRIQKIVDSDEEYNAATEPIVDDVELPMELPDNLQDYNSEEIGRIIRSDSEDSDKENNSGGDLINNRKKKPFSKAVRSKKQQLESDDDSKDSSSIPVNNDEELPADLPNDLISNDISIEIDNTIITETGEIENRDNDSNDFAKGSQKSDSAEAKRFRVTSESSEDDIQKPKAKKSRIIDSDED